MNSTVSLIVVICVTNLIWLFFWGLEHARANLAKREAEFWKEHATDENRN